MVQARDALLVIVSTLRLLVRQGLAVRGHEDIDSNFMQTLQVRSQDNEALANWLKREEKCKYESHEIQNEIIKMLAFEVLRGVIADIQEARLFTVIVDETADVAQHEQMRYVENDLNSTEDFIGFYQIESTSANALFFRSQ
jgi:bifunctional DNase/RNase